MSAEVHAIVRAQILESAEFYAKNLRALPEVELTHNRGARLPIDVTYEVVMVNRRLASRLRGQEPDPSTKETVAPELFRSQEVAVDEILGSAGELVQAWDEIGPDGMTNPIPAAGEGETALSLAIFATRHIQYHDGQISMTQQLAGDTSNHWAD